jgi:hypothetical protein
MSSHLQLVVVKLSLIFLMVIQSLSMFHLRFHSNLQKNKEIALVIDKS